MSTTASPDAARARLAGLTRHRGADDPVVAAARAEVLAAYRLKRIRKLREHLTDAERAALAVALLAPGSDLVELSDGAHRG